jgi:phosphoketolase
VVNVVDLMGPIRPRDHPHGMSDTLFRELFTDAVDVVFAFHGFPGAVHQCCMADLTPGSMSAGLSSTARRRRLST